MASNYEESLVQDIDHLRYEALELSRFSSGCEFRKIHMSKGPDTLDMKS